MKHLIARREGPRGHFFAGRPRAATRRPALTGAHASPGPCNSVSAAVKSAGARSSAVAAVRLVLLGDLAQEAAGQLVARAPVERPRTGIREVEGIPGPGDTHVAKPPLFFQPLLVQRARVRKQALLHPGDEHHRELKPLGVVEGHEGHQGLARLQTVDVGVEADLLEKIGQSALGVQAVELLPHAYEFLQVFQPPLGLQRPLRFEGRHETAPVEYLAHGLRHLARLGLPAGEIFAQPAAGAHRGARETEHLVGMEQGIPERHPLLAAIALQPADGHVAQSPPGRVYDPQQGDVVGWVQRRPKIRQKILDLRALVELGAPDDPVTDALPHEHVLKHTRLGVHAVEHGEVGCGPCLEQLDYLLADQPGLLVLVAALEHRHRLPGSPLGPEVLGLASPVVGHKRVGRVEDGGIRPVVLLQLDHVGVGEIVLKAEDVADIRSPPRVHRLVVVADHRHLPVLLGEKSHQHVLRPVGVLVFVHQDVTKQVAVVGEPLGKELQDVDRSHEKVVEVEGIGLEKAGLVAAVDGRSHFVETGVAVVAAVTVIPRGAAGASPAAPGEVIDVDELVLRVRDDA